MTRNRQQSKQQFVELHDRMGKRLLAYLMRRMLDKDAATELWAECWAIGFQQWRRCRAGTDAEAEAWMFGIARNQLASYYRTGSIQRKALERLQWSLPSVEGELDDALERVVDREALRTVIADALQTLPPMRRRAVRLRIVDGLSYSEVANQLGCSQQAARAHVSRGLKRLGDAVDPPNLSIAEVAI